jgi:hypothetical protein
VARSRFSFDRTAFVQRLRTALAGESVAEWSRRLDVHVNTLRNYIEGNRLPSCEFLAAVAEYRDTNVHWLLTGSGPQASPEGDDPAMWEQVLKSAPRELLMVEIDRRVRAAVRKSGKILDAVGDVDLPALAARLADVPARQPRLSAADEAAVAKVWGANRVLEDVLWFFPDYDPAEWHELDDLIARHRRLADSEPFRAICYWHMDRLVKSHSTP